MATSLGTQFSYGYDANGRLDQRQGEGADWQYGYAAANRLTSATHGADNYGYQYDPNGNRQEDGQQYDDFNKLLSSQTIQYDHDANGNRIRQTDLETGDVTEYGYDALNRLTRVEHYPEGSDTPAWNASYQYDAFNRRTGKTVTGTITEDTEYLWFGSRLVAEYNNSASTTTKRYRYTEGSFAPVGYSEGGNDYTVHSDYLDTPKVLTDTSGNVVWNTVLSPYGNIVENTDPDGDGQHIAFNPRFPGQYHDRETGLYYNWNRTYDPESGRYVQSDPIGIAGGLNSYIYGNSSPTMYSDPFGLYPGQDVVEFFPDAFGADKDFYDNYTDMRDANTIGADKYFHCKANCQAASRGLGGAVESQLVSELRELTDQYIKGDSPQACDADRRANDTGRKAGTNNPNVDCRAACSQYRPNWLSPQY